MHTIIACSAILEHKSCNIFAPGVRPDSEQAISTIYRPLKSYFCGVKHKSLTAKAYFKAKSTQQYSIKLIS
jgi:hypothetical protein